MKGAITWFDVTGGPDAVAWPIVGSQRIAWGREPIVPRAGLDWIEGTFDAGTHCIDPKTGQPVPLPEMAVTVDGNRISGIPEGARASVRMRRAEHKDGVLEIAVDHPETVPVRLSHPLFQAWRADLALVPGEASADAHRVEQDYRRLRMGAYPPLADLADALAKGDDDALESWRAACMDVKAKYPKEPNP